MHERNLFVVFEILFTKEDGGIEALLDANQPLRRCIDVIISALSLLLPFVLLLLRAD